MIDLFSKKMTVVPKRSKELLPSIRPHHKSLNKPITITPLNIYNGTPEGVLLDVSRETLPKDATSKCLDFASKQNATTYSNKDITLIENIELDRHEMADQISKILQSFERERDNVQYKKGIYIYGSPGSGKTHFVTELLKQLDYDIIKYDAGDVRNKSLVDTITSNNISNRNVLDMMRGRVKKIAIVMDEIDGMNNGDKGGINALIKIIRQKKTKKQKLENLTMNPIICIGNYYMDKKIKELIKVCHAFELKAPTPKQISTILDTDVPAIRETAHKSQIMDYVQGDMRKLTFIINLYKYKPHLVTDETLHNIFQIKAYNEDAKKITASLINSPASIQDHAVQMNDTDRTIVALLWHENIADMLTKIPPKRAFSFYSRILDNMCFADYMDRITFQQQIWVFNEMSSLIKTFYNNRIYHDAFPEQCGRFQPKEVRFTTVLTKYSTEYNNLQFMYSMSQELNMDKKDVIAFFQELRLLFTSMDAGQNGDFTQNAESMAELESMFETYDISKLDIRRMYRYLDKTTKKDAIVVEDLEEEDD
jgi:DNA polymerase III delta prime subunit